MVKKEVFKEIIRSFQTRPVPPVKKRFISVPLDSGKVVAVSGVRRSGKTFLLLDAVSRLLARGADIRGIIYVNFEDERLEAGRDDLDLILQAYGELYPDADLSKSYFFFDEIQNVEGWEKFVRRVYDSVSKNVFLTGSNSKLLSTDISTSLRGRNLTYEVYPLSFREYLSFSGTAAEMYPAASRNRVAAKSEEYLRAGGFPEVLSMEEGLRVKTLQEYFNVMLFKDLIERYERKPHAHLLKYFIKRLLACISTPVSVHKIYNELHSQGYKADKNLLYELLEELRAIYFFFPLKKYNESLIKREGSEKKIYVVDNGLATSVSFGFSEDRGKLLENAVFTELHTAGSEIYYIKGGSECDFVRLNEQGPPEVFQAACDLTSPSTKKREFSGLIKACKSLNLAAGKIVTWSEEYEERLDGVTVRALPFYKWALEFPIRSH
ncbi:MAG: ATP-binding protein [Elusimicrobiales bacterium]|jgi:hypothetical protein